MRTDNKPEIQHYVPKFILRNFADDKEQLHVFDKSTGRKFRPNLKNIAGERDFYVVEDGDLIADFEPIYTKIEDLAAPAIKKLLETESLKSLSPDEFAAISYFIAVQNFRTNQLRDSIRAMNEGLARHIKKMGFDTKQVKNFKELSEEDIKGVTVSFLKDAPKFANLMASKTWMLCKSAQKQFCISDHPIGLHNDKDYGPYGNLGLAVRGIEIYMPLSSSLAICLLCPREMEETFRLQKENRQMDAYFKTLSILGATPAIQERAKQAIISGEQLAKDVSLEKSNEMLGHIEAGTPIECSADHLLFMKYLQARFSKRFVFSANDNWHDIERMLKENPSWKSGGLKPKVG